MAARLVMMTVNACTSTVPPVPYMSLYPPFCLLSVQSYMDSNYGGQHPFRICLFLVILVFAMDAKEGMSKMPNHLTILAFNMRTGILSPQVDLQHPVHVLAMYITIAVLPTFLLYVLCHHKFSFLHIHAQLDIVHKKWVYS